MIELQKRGVVLVAGARPNFMKIAPIIRALDSFNAASTEPIPWILVHTGQHYDAAMSDTFFSDLEIPDPDVNLGVGSGSHARQTGAIMSAFEEVLNDCDLPMVVVVGDVNSSLACAIVAKKAFRDLAHVEAGLRSRDMAMPEEINRLVTDRLSDLLLTTDAAADANLHAEGVEEERTVRVGNVMIDTLEWSRERARAVTKFADIKARGPYALMTLHRPSNVDNADTFACLAGVLGELSAELPIIFACHPRTRQRMAQFDISFPETVQIHDPLSYMEMLNLQMDADLVFTDSGGLQEETTVLGTPCITLRENTERPVTAEIGTNVIVGTDPECIRTAFRRFRAEGSPGSRRPDLWDGNTSGRIVEAMDRWFSAKG